MRQGDTKRYHETSANVLSKTRGDPRRSERAPTLTADDIAALSCPSHHYDYYFYHLHHVPRGGCQGPPKPGLAGAFLRDAAPTPMHHDGHDDDDRCSCVWHDGWDAGYEPCDYDVVLLRGRPDVSVSGSASFLQLRGGGKYGDTKDNGAGVLRWLYESDDEVDEPPLTEITDPPAAPGPDSITGGGQHEHPRLVETLIEIHTDRDAGDEIPPPHPPVMAQPTR